MRRSRRSACSAMPVRSVVSTSDQEAHVAERDVAVDETDELPANAKGIAAGDERVLHTRRIQVLNVAAHLGDKQVRRQLELLAAVAAGTDVADDVARPGRGILREREAAGQAEHPLVEPAPIVVDEGDLAERVGLVALR